MAMDAYSTAAGLLGNMELSPDQLAQLRAIDYKYQLEVQHRLHARKENGPAPFPAPPRHSNTSSGLTPQDFASLRAMIVGDIRDMLTPEQRAALDRR
jgi:Spy/CpxP family protein refolding chaperone